MIHKPMKTSNEPGDAIDDLIEGKEPVNENRAKILGSSYSFEAGFDLLKVEKETSQSMNFPLYVLAMVLATSQLTQYKTIRSGLFVVTTSIN